MPKKVLMLVGDFVDDYELMVPIDTLAIFGVETYAICPGKVNGDYIKTVAHYISESDMKLAMEGKPVNFSESLAHPYRIRHTFDWESIDEEVKKFDGLLIPGGRAPEYLALIPDIQRIVSHFMITNKPIGAICHGSHILASTDYELKDIQYLKGKKIVTYPSLILEARLLGAIIDEDFDPNTAITDGNLVTAPTWLGLPSFMKNFLALLKITSIPD
jgi:protease I